MGVLLVVMLGLTIAVSEFPTPSHAATPEPVERAPERQATHDPALWGGEARGGMGHDAPPPAAPAAADDAAPEAIRHESGGVGIDQRERMQAGDYNLRLVFAERGSGAYLADVVLRIEDGKGRTVLQTESFGPWFNAQLPAGTYRVTATHAGKAQQREVTVHAQRASTLHFYWPPGDEPPVAGAGR